MTARAGRSASGSPEFDFAPGQPNLYRMMRYKQELFATLGVERGLEEFRRKFGWPDDMAPRQFVIESERDFASAHGSFFLETGMAGEPFVNMPPEVLGEGNHRPVHGVTRSQYVARLDDARVRGRSGAVVIGDRLLLDFQDGETARVDEEREWDPSIFQARDEFAWYLPAPNEHDPLCLPEAFNLLGAHSDFFGHWMCEYLPKYTAALLSGALARMPVLIDAHVPAPHRQALEFLFPELDGLIEIDAFQQVQVERLWVAPDLSYYPLYDSGAGRFEWDAISVSPQRLAPVLHDLRRRAEARPRAITTSPPRVFLGRKPFRHRRLVNDGDIHGLARGLGFLVIHPEELSFAEQVAIIQGAGHIVALEGSASFLFQFARPGTRACILSHPMIEAHSDVNEIYRAIGVEITVMTGPVVSFNVRTPHDSNYRIDPQGFAQFMGRWLGEP